MSRYGKCGGCGRKDGCQFLVSAKAALAGHGKLISSVKINCGRVYESDFAAGDRVRVKTSSDFGEADWGWNGWRTLSEKARQYLTGSEGTFLSWSKDGKANILFDREEDGFDSLSFGLEDGHEFCRVQSLQHRDIVNIDQPRRAFCPGCQLPFDEKGEPEFWFGRNGQEFKCGFYDGCAKRPSPRQKEMRDGSF